MVGGVFMVICVSCIWLWCRIWFSVLLLKMDSYVRVKLSGISSMLNMNLWMVWLCEMWVMNRFMNGV